MKQMGDYIQGVLDCICPEKERKYTITTVGKKTSNSNELKSMQHFVERGQQ
jgi:hypothetical protein